MSDVTPHEQGPKRIDQLLFAGLAGLSVAVVLQHLDKKPELDKYLWSGLLCFSVALPFLVSSFLLDVSRVDKGKTTGRMLFDLIGVVLALLGFGLVIFHLHEIIGVVFLCSAMFCFIAVRSLRS